jgi:hypothetical protein
MNSSRSLTDKVAGAVVTPSNSVVVLSHAPPNTDPRTNEITKPNAIGNLLRIRMSATMRPGTWDIAVDVEAPDTTKSPTTATYTATHSIQIAPKTTNEA